MRLRLLEPTRDRVLDIMGRLGELSDAQGLAAHLLLNKLRLFLTVAAVTVGVSFVSGTFVLSDTMGKAFDELYAGLTSGTDGRPSRPSIRSRSCARSALRPTSCWCAPTAPSPRKSAASCRCSATCARAPSSRRSTSATSTTCRWPITRKGWIRKCSPPSASTRRRSRAWSAGRRCPTASTIRKAR